MTHSDKSYLSTEDVSRMLGYSPRTITLWASAWLESGGVEGIPAFKLGRGWRFDAIELQAYIDGKKSPTKTHAA